MNKNVTIVWTKAHVGINGNEIVDKLAKEAPQLTTYAPHFFIPYTDLYSLARKRNKSKWQELYGQKNVGSAYKTMFPKITKYPWFYNEINRNFIRTLSRLRSQHALYPKHKKKIGVQNVENCECGEMGDLDHYILGCSKHRLFLRTVYQALDNMAQLPFNINSLLSSGNMQIYRVLYKFIVHRNIRL